MSTPTLAIWQFWTEYKPAPTPDNPLNMKSIDWVEYGPIGAKDRTTTKARVADILDRLQPLTDQGNPAIVMAHERARVIRAHYDAWKKGEEAPLHGTPLAAWNGLSPEQAKIFKSNNIRTVEEIALLNDANISHIPLPNVRMIVAQAKSFMDSADQVLAAKAISDVRGENDNLKLELADQRDTTAKLLARVEELATALAQTKATDEDAGKGSKGKKAA